MIKNYTTIIKKHSVEEIIIYLILAAGVLLSLAQFLYNRSLWLDEACLALNIIYKNSLELLKPLDYNQVAPILFLYVEKLSSILLPNTEYGLRLFPLLCFWGAIFFFYKIIKKLLHSPYAIIFALSLFVFNPTLIYYSSEVKQYMTDVFTLLALFYFVLKDYKAEQNKYYVLGIAGGIAIFLSNVAPIILATCGLYFLYEQFFVKKNKKIAALFAVFAVWLLLFALYYAFFVHNHPVREHMMRHWSEADAFTPHNPFKSHFYLFLFAKFKLCFFILPAFNVISGLFLVVLFLLGIAYLSWKKRTLILILSCIPMLLHLFLSALRLYPFDLRLILYMYPCIIIVCAIGLNTVFARLKLKSIKIFIYFIPIFLLYSFFNVEFPIKIDNLNDFPKKNDIKTGIKLIQENILEGENIYLYYFSAPPFLYYQSIGLSDTFNGHQIVIGSETIKDMKQLKGKYWLLFHHISIDSEQSIINQLDSIGYTKLDEFSPTGSAVYLYDFGE